MLCRARSSWLLTALLVLGLVMPAGVFASGPCCCIDEQDGQQIDVPQDAPSCCSTQSEAPASSGEEPADDDGCCDDCDCPGPCCFTGKAPVDATALMNSLPMFDAAELARPNADRWTEAATVFELVHPPRA